MKTFTEQFLDAIEGHLARTEDERRVVARLADAAFQAAEEGRAHLVQRRNGDFDFSYLAVKRGQPSKIAGAAPFIHQHALPAAA